MFFPCSTLWKNVLHVCVPCFFVGMVGIGCSRFELNCRDLIVDCNIQRILVGRSWFPVESAIFWLAFFVIRIVSRRRIACLVWDGVSIGDDGLFQVYTPFL